MGQLRFSTLGMLMQQAPQSLPVMCSQWHDTLQALSAAILGNVASSGDEDAKKSFVEAGGLEKLQELSRASSLASSPVRKAAARALSDITKGRKPRMLGYKRLETNPS